METGPDEYRAQIDNWMESVCDNIFGNCAETGSKKERRPRTAQKNILLTGTAGCGKSTVIEKVVQRLKRPCTGFFTREMRESGRRVGFSIETLDGRRATMAHVDIRSPKRVGKYGVDVQSIDTIAAASMVPGKEDVIVVVDEIGKMECLSEIFRQTLLRVLDSPNTVVGSIALKGDAFIGAVKRRSDTRLITVSAGNRSRLADHLMDVAGTSSVQV